MTTRIMVAGSYSGYNKGDFAILEGVISQINDYFNRVKIIIPSSNREYIESYSWPENVHFIDSFTSYLGKKCMSEIRNCDAIFIGGGGLIFERNIINPKFNHLINIYALSKIADILDIPMYYLSIGVEPIRSSIPQYLLRSSMEAANRISVRDPISKSLLDEYIDDPITIIPDPAFSLTPKVNDRVKSTYESITGQTDALFIVKRPIGLSKSMEKRFDTMLSQTITQLSSDYDITIIQSTTTQNYSHIISDRIPDRTDTIQNLHLTGSELAGFISLYDNVVSIPLHGSILSYISNTNFTSIIYSNKVEGFNIMVNNNKSFDIFDIQHVAKEFPGVDSNSLIRKENIRVKISNRIEELFEEINKNTR